MSLRLVFLWVISYAYLWFIITLYLDPTVPYDAVEALNWARNAEWGSPKNPWLPGLIMRPAILLPSDIYWYFIHFSAVAAGMLGAWLLAKKLSGSVNLSWLALLSLNLSGIINFDIISYNDNYLLVMLWPWMFLFFFKAISENKNWWLAFSIVAGLATMAKYSTLVFVSAIFAATLLSPRLRVCWRLPVFWSALFIGILLCLPNFIWLLNHNFSALKWVDSQITYGLNFRLLTSMLSVFYPLIILYWILKKSGVSMLWPLGWEHRIILNVYLFPILIISVWFLFHDGGRLTEWLQPFMIIAPALMISCVSDEKQFSLSKKTFISLWLIGALVMCGYVLVMMNNVSGAGKKMINVIPFSQQMEAAWMNRYQAPLKYVGGGYYAQWLTFYSPSKPEIIEPWDKKIMPNIYNSNISFSLIEKHGALLLGEPGRECDVERFESAIARWPLLSIDDTEQVMFSESPDNIELPLCIGFVRPK